ncbi:MAG TPA: hypothetical protein VMF86_07500 [Stellaceae bacterium]|nr:hypothetical protein [Stellaceae bacterium]
MGIFHSAQMADADTSATSDRDERLRPGLSIIVIALLSLLSWGIVALIATGLLAAL